MKATGRIRYSERRVEGEVGEREVGISAYSFLLTLALVLSAPWWGWRMLTSGRYREGLGERLGRVPAGLAQAVTGNDVIWLHAVSVGEVLAAERVIGELREALPGWVVAVSTTTAAGQSVARRRLAGVPVFYIPLDFAFAMRAYLRVLKPKLVVLMESELWPRMLVECEHRTIPVAVVNARVSDRSFPRTMSLRRLWLPFMAKVQIFLAQGQETAGRLERIGVAPDRIKVVGNLKYDAPAPGENSLAHALRANLPNEAKLVVCGSTLEGEEAMLLQAWDGRGVLLIAPRHPQRFDEVVQLVGPGGIRMSEWMKAPGTIGDGAVLTLDTLGNLAAVYELASVAFVGGSLVPKGGHNPLEPARFGVPVLMGPSYENFREIVNAMLSADAIQIVGKNHLGAALNGSPDIELGARGRIFYQSMAGATGRTVAVLLELLK